MKCFVIHICMQEGGREYGAQLVGRARSLADAEHCARVSMLEMIGNPDSVKWEGNELNVFGQIVWIEEVQEIPLADFAVLERYLPVVGR